MSNKKAQPSSGTQPPAAAKPNADAPGEAAAESAAPRKAKPKRTPSAAPPAKRDDRPDAAPAGKSNAAAQPKSPSRETASDLFLPHRAGAGTTASAGESAPPPEPEPGMLVLGLMSGTSVDALDMALVRIFGEPPNLHVKFKAFATAAYSPEVREQILRLAEGAPTTAGEISKLNYSLGCFYADCVLVFLEEYGIKSSDVGLLGSHGQTIFHEGGTATLQIAEPALIAARAGIHVVADFRPADIAAHGQGAPLVPFVDYLLLRSPTVGRVALNIGGIANITVIPPDSESSQIIAFDTGPGNMVIDALMRHYSGGKLQFDANGEFAGTGTLLPSLLEFLLKDPFFRKKLPRTAGREQFGRRFVAKILKWAKEHEAEPKDVVQTATVFTAATVARALEKLNLKGRWELVVSGGGAYNPVLMIHLGAMAEKFLVRRSDELGLPADAKEAIAFAVLAHEAWFGRPNSLPSATGAVCPMVLGKICYG